MIALAAALRARGHEPRIECVTEHVQTQDEESLPQLVEQLRGFLEGFDPGAIGISCRNVGAARVPENPFDLAPYYSAFYDARIVRALRRLTQSPVFIGGTAPTLEPGLYLALARPDALVLGEGEEVFPQLLIDLEHGKPLSAIDGIVRDAEDIPRAFEKRAQVQDLSSLASWAVEEVPDFDSLHYDGGGFVPVQSRRGCPMRCVYCSVPWLQGRGTRERPVADVAREMQHGWQQGKMYFCFVDNLFNIPRKYALRLCEEISQLGIDVKWQASLTPTGLDDVLVEAMLKAGCISVTISPDSGCDSVLRAYQKGFSVDQVIRAIQCLDRHGLPFDTCFVIGGPGETEETFEETIRFCERYLSNHFVRFYDGMFVETHAPLFQLATDKGLLNATEGMEQLILRNDLSLFRSRRYFFPDIPSGPSREKLMRRIAAACRRERWLLTSKDYVPDPETGALTLCPAITVREGDRPWWLAFERRA